MSNIVEELSGTIIEKMVKLKEVLTEMAKNAGRPAIVEHLKPFFAAHPDVLAIQWNQYAPYFNDGEPCVFSVNDPEAAFGLQPDGELDFRSEYERRNTAEQKATIKDLETYFEPLNILEDAMEEIFGASVEVIITREGDVQTDDYDHD